MPITVRTGPIEAAAATNANDSIERVYDDDFKTIWNERNEHFMKSGENRNIRYE